MNGLIVLLTHFRSFRDSQERLKGESRRRDSQERLTGETHRRDLQERLTGDSQERLTGLKNLFQSLIYNEKKGKTLKQKTLTPAGSVPII